MGAIRTVFLWREGRIRIGFRASEVEMIRLKVRGLGDIEISKPSLLEVVSLVVVVAALVGMLWRYIVR